MSETNDCQMNYAARRCTFAEVLRDICRGIVIPGIQRDYAQGRDSEEVGRIRQAFLRALKGAVQGVPIVLDFVYGDVNDGRLTPLDGQQRLTTLFLLHWYAALMAKMQGRKPQCGFLKGFSYETRDSSARFCRELTGWLLQEKPLSVEPNARLSEVKLSEVIDRQNWFVRGWRRDPTVQSMLTMLDDIHGEFSGVTDRLWERLTEGRVITFDFLCLSDIGLSDELYIKMNSRGKPLTDFEHFKAEFEKVLIRTLPGDEVGKITAALDTRWSEFLWRYCVVRTDADHEPDIGPAFLAYFRFVCDVIRWRKRDTRTDDAARKLTPQQLLEICFSTGPGTFGSPSDNIKTLCDFFDCWCKLDGGDTNPAKAFLATVMAPRHEPGKIVFRATDSDLLETCLGLIGTESKIAPVSDRLFLYAVVQSLLHGWQGETSVRRLRIVNNLIDNAFDEIRPDRMKALLDQIDGIVGKGLIPNPEKETGGFNTGQLEEERRKDAFRSAHPELAEALSELEDHPMLTGQIGILGIGMQSLPDRLAEIGRYAPLFRRLFPEDAPEEAAVYYTVADRALMAIGDYGQVQKGATYLHAHGNLSESWQRLFRRGAAKYYEDTGRCLIGLLEALEARPETDTESALNAIIQAFLDECERKDRYPWTYYYVKYEAFRQGGKGYMFNERTETEVDGKRPFTRTVLASTRKSSGSFIPFVRAAVGVAYANGVREVCGPKYEYGQGWRLWAQDLSVPTVGGLASVNVTCTPTAYELRRHDMDKELGGLLSIARCGDGDAAEDREDRVQKLADFLRGEVMADGGIGVTAFRP